MGFDFISLHGVIRFCFPFAANRAFIRLFAIAVPAGTSVASVCAGQPSLINGVHPLAGHRVSPWIARILAVVLLLSSFDKSISRVCSASEGWLQTRQKGVFALRGFVPFSPLLLFQVFDF